MTTVGSRNPRALIIDDDFVVQATVQDFLEESSFSVIEAHDATEGLTLFQKHHPDIVLLDVEMPGTNGFDACRMIRQSAGGKFVPIVMMTGHEDADSVDKAYEAGATDFVSKPMNFPILVHRLRHLLRSAEISDQLRRSQASLAQAQKIAKLGSWELDVENELLSCTDEAKRLIAPDASDTLIPLQDVIVRIHPKDRGSL